MFSIFHALIAILIASYASSEEPAHAISLSQTFLWSGLFLFFPAALGEILGSIRSKKWAFPLFAVFALSPIVTYAGIIFLAQWSQVTTAFSWPNSELLRHAILIFPFFVAELVYWSSSYRLQRRVTPPSGDYIDYQVRTLLFTFAPLFVYLAGVDLISQSRSLRVAVENISLLRIGVTVLFMLLLLILIPLAARVFWKTVPVPPGELRDRLDALSRKLDFRCRDILIWKTQGMTINAAILGLFPRFRYVILTDGLVSVLTPNEVEAVFGHELGHAKRHHVTNFVALAFAALFLFLTLAEFVLPQDNDTLLLLVSIVFLGASWACFGYLSRRFELEADLYGAAAVGELLPFVYALEKVGAFSGQGRWHGSWRHFSIGARVQFLQQIALDPNKGRQFLAKLKRASQLIFLVFAISAMTYVVLLAQKLPLEQAQVDLSQGRYAEAIQRLESAPEHPTRESLRQVAKLGLQIQQTHPQDWKVEILRSSRDKFLQTDFQAAEPLFALAVYLSDGPTQSHKLEQLTHWVNRRDAQKVHEYLEGEGKSLFKDLELLPILNALHEQTR